MPFYFNYLFCFYSLLSCSATAQTIQTFWTVPNGNVAQFTQGFYEGTTLPIAWEGWNASLRETFIQGVSVADLWITTYNLQQSIYTQRLTSKLCGRFTYSLRFSCNFINMCLITRQREYLDPRFI